MRFIIYGAGAIGGTIGGRLHQAGHDVVLICRGEHLRAIRANGLLLRTPEGDVRLPIPAVGSPREIGFRADDAVILTMKTQDTEPALRELERAAGTDIPVICAQNGIENERLALRRFANVYAMLVALPATFLVPGEVTAWAAPLSGALHAGRYPSGVDGTIAEVCAALSRSNFLADADPRAMRFKYRKLLHNLGNGLEIVTGRASWGAGGEIGAFTERMRSEGTACFAAAGIDAMPQQEYFERVQKHYRAVEMDGGPRAASSTLQSVMRGHTTVEVDYLNGEIELLGALHGVPTPCNSVVRRKAVEMAAHSVPPGSMSVEELSRLVDAALAPA
jgi:2-dehydropantoate 2-reductase